MKTFVEIHVLQNFAPSNLNRDDTGAPKDAFFGGTRRARVSSQCIKRAVRNFFQDQSVAKGLFSSDDVAVRTKRLMGELVKKLVAKKRPEEDATAKVKQALAAVKLTVKDDGKTEYLLFLGQREIDHLAKVIDGSWDAIVTGAPAVEGQKASKAKKDAAKAASPELKKALESVMNGGKSVDIALFGRMLADMPENNQNAACQVAHAISTHAVEREFDFYTAVDDLKPEDTAGADMMGTVEFNAACFYRYALVDLDLLIKNLQGDAALASNGVGAFLEGFVVAEPTGKQNTFAAHNAPEFVAITVRRGGAPRNLANAFERPVRVKTDEILTGKSAEALIEKAKSLAAAFDGGEKIADHTWVLNLVGAKTAGFGVEKNSLAEILESVATALSNTSAPPAGA
jgi:CRISPR system Cascade subunit CasC